jgi:hypothetical protein
MAKTWSDRLTQVETLVDGFDDDGAWKFVESHELSNLVLIKLKDDLTAMTLQQRKAIGQALHLGSKKNKDWRKYVRALLLLELVLVPPLTRRTKTAVVNACLTKDAAALRLDLKGMIKALDPWLDFGNADLALVRPVKIGCSISGGNATGPGSIGCFVRCRQNGRMMLLTNQHVAKQEFGPDPSKPDPDIRQPAKLNGGQVTNNIAVYARGKLDKTMDAAVCYLNAGVGWSNETRQGPLQASIPIVGVNNHFAVNDAVWKCGCMSFIAHGRIQDVDKDSTVPHAKFGGNVAFEHQIEVKSVSNRQFQIPGDSGSCLINQANEIIGLLHGGLKGGAVATPIEDVFDEMDVDFVAGSGTAV